MGKGGMSLWNVNDPPRFALSSIPRFFRLPGCGGELVFDSWILGVVDGNCSFRDVFNLQLCG